MIRRRPASHGARRGTRHGRHGRLGRSEVVRPPLPPLDGRLDRFDLTVSSAVEFLRGTWPELEEVRFEIGTMPPGVLAPGATGVGANGEHGVPRWRIDRDERRIVLFRLPIERFLSPGHDDALHRRVAVESSVFRAGAEYVGRDPWEIGPES